jgi:hypothetical protein
MLKHGLSSIGTALYATSNPLLENPQRALRRPIPTGVQFLQTFARGDQAGDANIHANLMSGRGE